MSEQAVWTEEDKARLDVALFGESDNPVAWIRADGELFKTLAEATAETGYLAYPLFGKNSRPVRATPSELPGLPDEGRRIVTPCPECGAQSLFIGSGGHLTCARVPSDHGDGCSNPSVDDVVKQLKQRAERAESALMEAREKEREKCIKKCDEIWAAENMSKHVSQSACQAARSAISKCMMAIRSMT
jgi:hypothetical protein